VAASGLGPQGRAELERLIDAFDVEVVPFTAPQAALAADAWRRFGKGRHRAALDILDCCSYALAREARRPLPALGSDFARTDVTLANLAW